MAAPEFMKTKTAVFPAALLLLCLLLYTGCAGYGSARYYRNEQQKLPELMANFHDHHVYYSGMSEDFPSGLIFDPKNDGRTVAQKEWIRVESRDLMEKLVRKLELYHNYPPRLYDLTGEDGQNYGYIYTSYKHIVIRQIGENRIHVYEMPEPPHLKYDPNGGFKSPE